MKSTLLLAFAAAAVLAAMPAAATPATAISAYDAGRCLVHQDRGAAVALLARLPLDQSPTNLGSVGARANAACVAGLGQVPAMLARGAIAQALLLNDFDGLGRPPREGNDPVALNLPVESSPQGSETVELYRWGDCVVRNDPAGAETLLRSAVGSPEESGAVRLLGDTMSNCMPTGRQLSVLPWQVRSVFAQSAYNMYYRFWTGELRPAQAH